MTSTLPTPELKQFIISYYKHQIKTNEQIIEQFIKLSWKECDLFIKQRRELIKSYKLVLFDIESTHD